MREKRLEASRSALGPERPGRAHNVQPLGVLGRTPAIPLTDQNTATPRPNAVGGLPPGTGQPPNGWRLPGNRRRSAMPAPP